MLHPRYLPHLQSCTKLLLLACWLLLPACNPGDGNGSQTKTTDTGKTPPDAPLQEEHQLKNSPPGTDTLDFEVAFAYFFEALQNADTAKLQQFVDPELGVWLIEQPGAVPKMTHVRHLSRFKRDFQDRSFLTVRDEMKECHLQEEPFPRFDCAEMEGDKSGYSKDGCFAWKADKFRQSGYWNYASLPPDQIQQIQETLPLVQKSVLHTGTSFEFHFGYVHKQWRLLFVKLIYPCSA